MSWRLLGGAVVAASVIMMGQGRNEEALKEETKAWRIDASLSMCAHVVDAPESNLNLFRT